MSVDGELGHPMRPICNFVVPPGLTVEATRQLVSRVSSAIAEACNLPRENVPLPSGKKVSTRWVLGFFIEYPLDQASLDDLNGARESDGSRKHGGSHATPKGQLL